MTRQNKIAIADALVFLLAAQAFAFLVTMEIRDDLFYGLLGDLCALGCALAGHWRPE